VADCAACGVEEISFETSTKGRLKIFSGGLLLPVVAKAIKKALCKGLGFNADNKR
jgi:hypothetical protein